MSGERSGLFMISIHALLAEGDLPTLAKWRDHLRDFYPRPPCGGRQKEPRPGGTYRPISIHALLAEGDGIPALLSRKPWSISIHALLAEGDIPTAAQCPDHPISIHALLAEGDLSMLVWPSPACISIHALLAEGDQPSSRMSRHASYFYPRPPCGGRPTDIVVPEYKLVFLSTPSLRRATRPLSLPPSR